MTNATRWWCVAVLAMGATLFAVDGSNFAQEKKKPHDASALNEALRDVINVGAKMFNEQGDYTGCYRLYQGSLISVRPFVAPDLKRKIDDGIGAAERMGSYADRVFELRRVLDEIRASTKAAGDPKEKKIDAKMPIGVQGQVSGTIMFQGKPLPGGYSVTLVSKQGKKFTTTVNETGSFQFKMPISAGDYRVAIEPKTEDKLKLPARYLDADKSGLMLHVEKGEQKVELKLVN